VEHYAQAESIGDLGDSETSSIIEWCKSNLLSSITSDSLHSSRHGVGMTIKEIKSFADFQTIVRRAHSLRHDRCLLTVVNQPALIRSTRAKSSSLTSGLRGVDHANSSPLSSNISRTWTRTAQSSSVRSNVDEQQQISQEVGILAECCSFLFG